MSDDVVVDKLSIKDRLERLEKENIDGKKGVVWKLKIPSSVVRNAQKKNTFCVLLLGANSQAFFTNAVLKGGNLLVGDESFAFENCSVFIVGKKKVPLVVLYSWRITPVAGFTDAVSSSEDAGDGSEGLSVVDVRRDALFANKYGLANYGQQTIIRSLQQASVGDVKKGLGGMSMLWWIIGGVVVLYMIQQMFAGG